jgi:hypothetical protein
VTCDDDDIIDDRHSKRKKDMKNEYREQRTSEDDERRISDETGNCGDKKLHVSHLAGESLNIQSCHLITTSITTTDSDSSPQSGIHFLSQSGAEDPIGGNESQEFIESVNVALSEIEKDSHLVKSVGETEIGSVESTGSVSNVQARFNCQGFANAAFLSKHDCGQEKEKAHIICEHCDLRFSRSDARVRHIRTKHGDHRLTAQNLLKVIIPSDVLNVCIQCDSLRNPAGSCVSFTKAQNKGIGASSKRQGGRG